MNEFRETQVAVENSNLSAFPFPHIFTNSFFNSDLLSNLQIDLKKLEETTPDNIFSSNFGEKREWKKFPKKFHTLYQVIDFLQSKTFIDTLKEKFEIPVEVDIFSDNYFDGGGFVISPPNSYLGYHADFNFSSKNHKYRVLNLLIYMNPEYKIEYGGHLHALDPISKTVEAIYVPFMNSAFAFFTDDKSFHGVSRNRSDFYRRSFNLYYYADKPISEFQSRKPHKTIWLDIEKGNYEH